jgi:predicted aspartyl protease
MKAWALLWVGLLSASIQAQNEIHFRLIDNWAIVVNGTLAQKSHVDMLIDTGAVPSAIDSRLAKQMGLSGNRSEISVMNRAIAAERVRVPEIRVGQVIGKELEMVAVDLSKISQALGIQIEAVIGLDLLGKQNFTLDYRHRRIEFGKVSTGMVPVRIEVAEEGGGMYIVIPVESEGQKWKLLLDTGTKDLMLFDKNERGRLNALPTRARVSNVNAGGGDHLNEIQLPSVSLGTLTRKKQRAYIWPITEDKQHGFDGVLGPTAFGISAIQFDFRRGMIQVRP